MNTILPTKEIKTIVVDSVKCGSMLKAAREVAGISQVALAKLTGAKNFSAVSAEAMFISRVESGRVGPVKKNSKERFQKLMKLLSEVKNQKPQNHE